MLIPSSVEDVYRKWAKSNSDVPEMTLGDLVDRITMDPLPLSRGLDLNTEITDKVLYLVDTRSKEEFGVSHLNDSMHEDVFFETIEPKLSQIPSNLWSVVFLCTVGYRSGNATRAFLTRFPGCAAYNLACGILGVTHMFPYDTETNPSLLIVNELGASDTVHSFNKSFALQHKSFKAVQVPEVPLCKA
eukprot:TRINITY_DN11327_c0_g1_i1.p1 TRINITY_DN11327_c0_g1~~TRINITY_DN11327_c0_g1_i1.p1  ORF type:complete len:188 (-),score=13.67 TRINITY_DN11327_c0_g1_i1:95-658(-)